MSNTNVTAGARQRDEVDEEKKPYPDTDTLYGLVLAQKDDWLHSEVAYTIVADVAASDDKPVEPPGLAVCATQELGRELANRERQRDRMDVCCFQILDC